MAFTLPNVQSLAFVEDLYAQFLRDPVSVESDWQKYFESFASEGSGALPSSWRPGPTIRRAGLFDPRSHADANCARPISGGAGPAAIAEVASLQDRVDQLVREYRVRGHTVARIDPLERPRGPEPPELNASFYRLTEVDMDRPFSSATIPGVESLTLRGIILHLRNTYCRSIGVQFMHIDDPSVRHWLQNRMEATQNRLQLSRREQLRILTRLTNAFVFEEFIRKTFTGAKAFSLEGAESLLPLLDLAIEKAGEQGINEIVLGMAHRGRLNVLANVMGKSAQAIFREFEDVDAMLHLGHGDVKYHLGHNSDWTTDDGSLLRLSLCFNPSHLEFVDPVVLGRVRAKQDRAGDAHRGRAMALVIHGDAAFAGEGVVQETLLLSQLPGYTVGGTLHVVVNNQIGFTATTDETTSSVYSTDVAKMLQIPIFHVNGEDPEAVAQVVRLAMDFRRAFQRDVVIDMLCYRRHGHNESDEPAFTQPLMYRAIERRQSVHEGYLEHLLQLGEVTRDEADKIVVARRKQLEAELVAARSPNFVVKTEPLGGVWSGFYGGPSSEAFQPDSDAHASPALLEFQTGVDERRLRAMLEALTRLPDDFHPHPKIERGLRHRAAMARGEKPLDWSTAEALAFATLAGEGIPVRLSGQDSQRGTFSQRHAMLHDYQTGRGYMPLANLGGDAATVEIFNSPLSETGVLGFDYGYSLECPDGLVLWEAQFGDFVNAAQVIVDQFIAAAEDKWQRLSGIVLLLPHGFEGMGPEHSHARIERFLALAADDNIQVVQPTTPAQYFHVLRRQVKRCWRKPLVVMTPKSLLRHPESVSSLKECGEGHFQMVIPDAPALAPSDDTTAAKIERVLLTSGKIYYDLLQERERLSRHRVAIVRLEQLYPLPLEPLQAALASCNDGTPVTWVQEEPENMGAWRYLRVRFGEKLFQRLPLAGVYRSESASPATGSFSAHKFEQQKLLTEAFG